MACPCVPTTYDVSWYGAVGLLRARARHGPGRKSCSPTTYGGLPQILNPHIFNPPPGLPGVLGIWYLALQARPQTIWDTHSLSPPCALHVHHCASDVHLSLFVPCPLEIWICRCLLTGSRPRSGDTRHCTETAPSENHHPYDEDEPSRQGAEPDEDVSEVRAEADQGE